MSETVKSVEIELKLVLPGSQAEAAVIDFLQQSGYGVEKIAPLDNIDIYMDTSNWSLLKNKLSLRYRLSNNKALYTMKSIGGIEDGIARRAETEIELKSLPHTPTGIPVKSLKKQVDEIIFPRKLMEQILIRTSRRRYMVVSPEGTQFEMAFDASSFSADAVFKPRRAPRLYELEAELIKGKEQDLSSLASLLAGRFAFPPSTASKLESAMTRLKVEPLVKKVPENLKIKLDDRLDTVLKKILAVEFNWFREQLPGVITDRDPEFVHQARVTTRRMRSALVLFHNALPESTVTYLEDRLKTFGKLFGAVRDLDVFIINLNGYRDKIQHFPEAKKQALESLVIKQRRAPLKALNEALNSRRYQNFERRMMQLIDAPPSVDDALPMSVKPLSEVAPQVITQKFENVMEQSRKTLAGSRLDGFHCLRIQMKRLRYAFEFMAPPYGGVFDDIIRRTVEIQDCLGALQDTVFNQKFIRDILKEWQGKLVEPDLIFILGEIYQLQGEIARQQQEHFQEIWRNFTAEQMDDTLRRIFNK
ncbi:MAG: CHAD domain-containing protein [Dehalococcoidales bacterium]|jgi:CHAD domain-containing protein